MFNSRGKNIELEFEKDIFSVYFFANAVLFFSKMSVGMENICGNPDIEFWGCFFFVLNSFEGREIDWFVADGDFDYENLELEFTF
jgi:hypothetical protein